MDRTFLSRIAHIGDRLRNRIQKLPIPRFKASPQHKRSLRALVVLLIAGALGLKAHELTSAESRAAWERAHPPSPVVWRYALGSRGFREIIDPDALHRAARTLPSQAEPEGSVWISSDSWVTVYAPSEEGGLRIYCTRCKPKPLHWTLQGKGWVGLETALASLASAPRSAPSARGPARDPLEIQY